ncbi:MAG: type II toxin-antitoxin system VapC family toxin [Actinobacteria bacterium]|nr:type II toxin-antitoxin system VapC family toxin [Actinomycetota bacterium]
MTLVLDASVAVYAALAEDGFAEFDGEQLIAPPLMWSEARSVLHELVWRREVTAQDGEMAFTQLERAPVSKTDHDELGREAWRIANEMGWAKTYDAEYLALAFLSDCRLVTTDARLHRATGQLGFVVSPAEL